MAESIPRDLSSPFNTADSEQMAEFEGFASDVPNTGEIIGFADGDPVSRANVVRATNLFSPAFLSNLTGLSVIPDADFPTPDFVANSPNAIFERRGMEKTTLNVPGGGEVEIWSFEARVTRGVDIDEVSWPAPIIRVREGEIVHTLMGNSTGPHTIHHHGIEPTAANDGVGHLTFEVSGGNYAYQWQAGEAGTYFYHCHRNTTLHFEMGMYGMLIVDPNVGNAPYPTGGPGFSLVGDEPVSYDVEAIWAADDIDTRWHGVDVGDTPGPNGGILYNGAPVITDHHAGLQDIDVNAKDGFVSIDDIDNNPRLHDFNPNVFVVSGQAAPAVPNTLVNDVPDLIPAVGATLVQGQRLLARTLNASYCTVVWNFPTSLQGTVTAKDGRTLGRAPFGSYSQSFSLASVNHRFTHSTAQRWDILIDSTGASTGTHLVEIEFRHHITNNLLRTVRVPIYVNSAV